MVFFVSTEDPTPAASTSNEPPVWTPGAGTPNQSTAGTTPKGDVDKYGRGNVNLGYTTGLFGSADRYAATGEGRYVSGERELSFNQAQKYFYDLRARARGSNATIEDKQEYKGFVDALKGYTNSDFKSIAGENAAFDTVLKDAGSAGVNVFDLLSNAPKGAQDGSGRSGSRAYTGPTATTTLANERDLRSTADAVASTVIGRGITDEEFQKVLKQVRTAERAEPTVSTSGVGSSVTQSGLSAQGRQDIIRDSLMKGPEAEDYGKATKMMDLFYKTLEARPEGA